MLITNPNLIFSCSAWQETKTTTAIVRDSINITNQLYNDLHSSSSSCSLQLVNDDSGLIEDLINETLDVTVFLNSGNVRLFTGYLSNDHSWRVSMTGEDVFQIKIEDMTTRRLDNVYTEYDDVCIRDTLENVIESIRDRSGIVNLSYDSSVTSDIKNKILVNKISSSTTCKDMLDTICYEFGLVYYMNSSGHIIIKKTDLSDTPDTTVATTDEQGVTVDHYLYEEGGSGIDLTRKARQYSQTKVKYNTISDSSDPVQIYAVTDNITVGSGEWWDGTTHSEAIYQLTLDEVFTKAHTYYTVSGTTYTQATIYERDDSDPTHEPRYGEVIPDNTYYEYAGQASRVNMNDIEKGKDILYVYPNSITPNVSDRTTNMTGYVEKIEDPAIPSKWTLHQYRNTTNLEVLIDNTQGATSAIYSKFSAKGRIIRKSGTGNIYRSLVGLTGSNSKSQFNYEAEWIHDKNDAIALAELLSKYYLYCDNTYTFYCKDDIELGSVVRVYENVYSGLDTNMFLIAKQYTAHNNQAGVYKYTAQGMTAFDLTQTTTVQDYNEPEPQPTLTSVLTEYALSSQGTDPTQVTGWSTTIPTLTVGMYLWTRTTYTYSNGKTSVDYSVSTNGEEQFEFIMNTNTSNVIRDDRNYNSQDIRVTISLKGYTDTPVIKAWWDEMPTFTDPSQTEEPDWEFTGTVADIFIQPRTVGEHKQLCILSYLPTSRLWRRIYLKTINNTEYFYYAGEFNIDTSDYFDADGNFIPENYDQINFGPVNLAIKEHFGFNYDFIDGDSFFNNHSETGFKDCFIYVWEGGAWSTGHWTPINYSNFSNSEKSKICAQAQKDVLSTIKPGSVTKSDYGYFNTIIAGTVTADYIGGKEIEVHDGGFIYGGTGVDISQPPGQRITSGKSGFVFDSYGNAEMSNIRITGNSTVEGSSTVLGTLVNYDSNNSVVFKTVKETTTQATMRGGKVDGTDAPSAYLWSEFTPWLKTAIAYSATSGTYYSCSNSSIYGTWDGEYQRRSVQGLRYFSSFPSQTQYNASGSAGPGTVENVPVYTNSDSYWKKFYQMTFHPKTDQSIWGVIGYGELKVTIYYQGGSIYQVLCDQGEKEGTGGVGMVYKYNVMVPPGGYIVAECGTYSGHPWGHWDTDFYANLYYKEEDNFSLGVNFIDINSNIYAIDDVLPSTITYNNNYQTLNCSGISMTLNMTMEASSTWPVTKYYMFQYAVSPGTTEVVTSSIFSSQSFSYEGVPYIATSITFSNTSLKVTDIFGYTYEFDTLNGHYYPEYSFDFTVGSQSLGGYARTMNPTDDANFHSIGDNGSYASGNSQRWDAGYFKTLDVSQGIIAQTINSAWTVPITDGSTATLAPVLSAIANMPVGTMNFFMCTASGVTLSWSSMTMEIIEITGSNAFVKTSSSSSYTSTASNSIVILIRTA